MNIHWGLGDYSQQLIIAMSLICMNSILRTTGDYLPLFNTSRTLRASVSGVKGFWRKGTRVSMMAMMDRHFARITTDVQDLHALTQLHRRSAN
jgi:hypothetical protein